MSRWEAVIRDGLLRMKERGELSPGADPAKLAVATLAALQGGLLLTHAHRDPALFETALDAAIARIRSFGTPVPTPPAAEPGVSAAGDTLAPAATGYCPHCREPVTIVPRAQVSSRATRIALTRVPISATGAPSRYMRMSAEAITTPSA